MPMLLRGFAHQQELSRSTLPVRVLRSKPRPPEVSGDVSGLANLNDLRLIFFWYGELLLDLQDVLGYMFSEKTLHVGYELAQKIVDRIRTQGPTKAVHRIPQVPIMSRIVTILQRAAE